MISRDQYDFLTFVRSNPGCTVSELADLRNVSTADIQKLCRDLKALGALEIKTNLDFVSRTEITERGKALIEEYESAQREENRSDQSLRAAKRANLLATIALIVSVIALICNFIPSAEQSHERYKDQNSGYSDRDVSSGDNLF